MSKRTILVVDDSAVARRALTSQLSNRGVDFAEAAGVRDALLAANDELAAAVLDLDLGDDAGDGVAIARALRASHASLPVAFFTGGGTPQQLHDASVLGRVFHKPEELDDVVAWALAAASRQP